MAESLSHKFGQIIGDLLELAIYPRLEKFASEHQLYLDKHGERPARSGKKVSWTDNNGNTHDLDFVLERGGTKEKIGAPVAFIESAWRRYTKHSRNKAQEIQSAIIPLSERYAGHSPFIGVVLAGVFTEGALNQLKSLKFGVLYFPYETVTQAFLKHGINAKFDEKTPEEDFKTKIDGWQELSYQQRQVVANELLLLNHEEVEYFFSLLAKSVSRFIERVTILPLHGQESSLVSISQAIDFLKQYFENALNLPFARYEIMIRYNTGDKIEATFRDRADAIQFLQTYL